MSYLFGSILTVPGSDLMQMLLVGVVIIALVFYFYNAFLAMSYDEEFARIRGVPVKPLYFLLIGMLSVATVMIIQVVGLILVIALLTIPPFIAEKYSKSLFEMIVWSCGLSICFTVIGLWLSYTLNLTSGATIILVAGAGFCVSIIIEHFWSRKIKI
jgi:zinc transport system permease protein